MKLINKGVSPLSKYDFFLASLGNVQISRQWNFLSFSSKYFWKIQFPANFLNFPPIFQFPAISSIYRQFFNFQPFFHFLAAVSNSYNFFKFPPFLWYPAKIWFPAIKCHVTYGRPLSEKIFFFFHPFFTINLLWLEVEKKFVYINRSPFFFVSVKCLKKNSLNEKLIDYLIRF